MDELIISNENDDSQQLSLAFRPDRTPAMVYVARLAPGSRRTMAQALNTIAEILSCYGRETAVTLPWHELDYQHTAALRSELAARYAPATANKMLSALRGVLTEAWRLGLMNAEQCRRACDVKAVRGKRTPKGRALIHDELSRLFESCDRDATPSGIRDAALLAVLYSAGLRRAEAVGLDLADYSRAGAALRVHAGKGNKGRVAYLNDAATGRLDIYVQLRGDWPGPLFVGIRRGGHMSHERLSDQAVRYILLRRCEQAGVPPASPHDLRRTFASDMLDAGVDISTVQQLMGHASPNTTAAYDRRGDATKRSAVQKLRGI
jgi:site-specific recombinase XerD